MGTPRVRMSVGRHMSTLTAILRTRGSHDGGDDGSLSQRLSPPAAPLNRAVPSSAPSAVEETRGFWPALFRVYPALSSPTFRLLWLGSIPSTMAWNLCVIATGYAALTRSGSATDLGIVTSLGGLPMLVLAPIGGVVADRLPRRTVLFFTQATLGLGAAVLATLSMLDMLQTWHLGAVAFSQGIAFSFNMPARQALAMDVAGPRLARSAAALNTTGANFSRVVGPSVAGLLLAIPAIGVAGVFWTMTLMYGIVMATLTRVPSMTAANTSKDGGGLTDAWGQLIEGFRYIFGSPLHRSLLTTALVVVALGMPVLQIMPVFSERVYEVGPAGLGLMMAANGVGALTGSIGVAALTRLPHLGLIQVGFGVALGVTIVGFSPAPSFAVAVVLLALFGACQASYMSLNGTLLLGNTEPRMYGRVLSLYLKTFAVSPICALPLAWATDHIGARPSTAVVGALVIVAMLVVTLRSPTAAAPPNGSGVGTPPGVMPQLARHLRRVPGDPYGALQDRTEAEPVIQRVASLRRAEIEEGSATLSVMLHDVLKQRATSTFSLMLGRRSHRPDADSRAEARGLNATDRNRPLPRKEELDTGGVQKRRAKCPLRCVFG